MKLSATLFSLLLTSLLFAQQETLSNINDQNLNDIWVGTKNSDFSLNLKKFKLSQLVQVNNPFDKRHKISRSLMINQKDGILIIVPNKILFPTFFDTKENSRDIDTIYDFENSIYFFRNAG